MRHVFSFLILFFMASQGVMAQKMSLLVLGDLHYDRLEDHDMEWLSRKPDDLRQVTKEYVVFTDNNWVDFMGVLRRKIQQAANPVQAVVQLGDLSEGLAGSEQKADQMAGNVIKAITDANLKVPWLLTKGNHDVTGPGSDKAFKEHYLPLIRQQAKTPGVTGASYSWVKDDVQVAFLDPWDQSVDMATFLEEEFSGSGARFKFVAIHEPVIPVTERCWHTLKKDPGNRERLLEVIARHKAIVLCGHLHRYSVVRRNTQWGPIIQVMAVSVVRDRKYLEPSHLVTKYGPSIAENVPAWQPETMEARKAILAEEARYVTYYKQTDLPGYAILTMDSKQGRVQLEYYPAFGKRPYDTIDLTALAKQ